MSTFQKLKENALTVLSTEEATTITGGRSYQCAIQYKICRKKCSDDSLQAKRKAGSYAEYMQYVRTEGRLCKASCRAAYKAC